MTREPITFSLLITSKQIQQFVSQNPSSRLLQYYNAAVKMKVGVLAVEENMVKLLGGFEVKQQLSILDNQKELEDTLEEGFNYFKNFANRNNTNNSLNMVKNI